MIRDYNQADIEEIVRLHTLEYKAMPAEIENLKSASKILVYEDRGIKGFIHLEMSGNHCYVEMGAATSELIIPDNWYLNASKEAIENNRKVSLEEKEYNYLFFKNNEILGASMVKNAEIELLFVNIKYQRKGYGKKILEYTINRGLEQSPTSVNLNALASNEKALKLYKDLGFKVVQAQDARRLNIGGD
ncbi:GNAT family N-acetyltransferase [Clostridium sp. D2Q-11]|uniref:GNAT family N-acetyltransferase n=1 Tax=Anaeromonas frigoriresistens TaxID=2683708 RepID=A0A942UY24_9FIRM|nr:GNAT family N-acetyltransferase [Anaeromonas frigoriresistens]MBS4537717.1 GNAT family N-acetyltransferase [Anaeromonas frigoriresistens]